MFGCYYLGWINTTAAAASPSVRESRAPRKHWNNNGVYSKAASNDNTSSRSTPMELVYVLTCGLLKTKTRKSQIVIHCSELFIGLSSKLRWVILTASIGFYLHSNPYATQAISPIVINGLVVRALKQDLGDPGSVSGSGSATGPLIDLGQILSHFSASFSLSVKWG